MHTSLISSQSDAKELVAHVTYQIAGFDRLNFVSDITNTIPQDEGYTIRALAFEGDGIQASGLLTVQMQEEHRLNGFLVQRLRSVRGMVSVREV
ncbi:hypothetical protein [Spirosoma radiotolerans]|uniref:ACT domain-containing protein n=1 Tax=Spirosoma radiotolerans TaxID=1379870 RepID=A0A0E3ZWT3_9BACT|nr:hypothetical protein [Spirosoma radiotolerans]AKD55938.1 hypothetical protein SD10_14540 [Spirosoma radiotolerans]